MKSCLQSTWRITTYSVSADIHCCCHWLPESDHWRGLLDCDQNGGSGLRHKKVGDTVPAVEKLMILSSQRLRSCMKREKTGYDGKSWESPQLIHLGGNSKISLEHRQFPPLQKKVDPENSSLSHCQISVTTLMTGKIRSQDFKAVWPETSIISSLGLST